MTDKEWLDRIANKRDACIKLNEHNRFQFYSFFWWFMDKKINGADWQCDSFKYVTERYYKQLKGE